MLDKWLGGRVADYATWRYAVRCVSTHGANMAKKAEQANSTRDAIPGLGSAIRARREALGLTLAALGEKIGTGASAIVKVELGQRALSFRLARDIAVALGVTTDALLLDAARLAERTGST